MTSFWIYLNFAIYAVIFLIALCKNLNFTTCLVGVIYLLPLIPVGMTEGNLERFWVISCFNAIFGAIELAIFVRTVRPGDATFDKPFFQQLFGHTLPIAAALIGTSFVARSTEIPVSGREWAAMAGVFTVGAFLRVLAVYQLGLLGFKLDIAFRDRQTLKTDKLYGRMRHPSYTAMMVVILAYALATHSWLAGGLGLLSAWFGFQYRIYHEERALERNFGEQYRQYRNRTPMWFPRMT